MLKKNKKKIFGFILVVVLAVASFLRFFRLKELLGFWYDQGRDALVIWDLIKNGKMFLIGPTTGIEGVFRGPWYYYLITPFYYLGNGNPVYPMIFLTLIAVFAIFVLYKVGESLGGKKVALISAFIGGLSIYIVNSSRWLSNPTPMLLIGISMIWAIYKFMEGKKYSLPAIALLAGMAMNFGSAMEIFYFPALLSIFIWKRKNLPNIKTVLLSIGIFIAVFVPQILFEIRHPGVLTGPIQKFLFQDGSFSLSFWELLKVRIPFYYSVFYSKFWLDGGSLFAPFFAIAVLTLIFKGKEIFKNQKFIVVFLFTFIPFLGGLFFSGNHGNVYDYYFTGYYLIFILFFSFLLAKISEKGLGKIIVLIFLIIFSYKNITSFKESYGKNIYDYKAVYLGMETPAIDWVYKDAGGRDFNVDVYVPPVIPYAYDYLFKWLGETKYGKEPKVENVNLLYTLYEEDLDHPERLKAWLERQKGIGTVIKEEKFGMIVVQERQRIKEK